MTHSWPIDPRLCTSEYGPRTSPTPGASSFHRGIDLAKPRGYPVYASEDGVIEFARYDGTAGNHTIIRHSPSGVQQRTHYMHQIAIDTPVGTKVRKGQQIGRVGMTGAATGPHLHYGCEYPLPVLINPRQFMASFGDGKIIGISYPTGGETPTPLPTPTPSRKAPTMYPIFTSKNRDGSASSPFAAQGALVRDNGLFQHYDSETPAQWAEFTAVAKSLGVVIPPNKDAKLAPKAMTDIGPALTNATYSGVRSSQAAALAAAGSGGVGPGFTLAQLVAAVDAADDDEHAVIVAAINAAAKAGGTPADIAAEFSKRLTA